MRNRLKIIVKPNSSKTEVIGWDDSRHALRIAVAAPPDKNKANLALMKFLSKRYGSCSLVSGASAREKIVEFSDVSGDIADYLK